MMKQLWPGEGFYPGVLVRDGMENFSSEGAVGTQNSRDLQHMSVAVARPGWTSDLWDGLTCPQIVMWLKLWALVNW